QLDPGDPQARAFLPAHRVRDHDLDDGRGLLATEQHDVGDRAIVHAKLFRRVRDVLWKVLDDAAVASVDRAGTGDAGCRTVPRRPCVDHRTDELLGRTVQRA